MKIYCFFLISFAAREIETEPIALKYCSQFYENEEIDCQKIGSGRQLSSQRVL